MRDESLTHGSERSRENQRPHPTLANLNVKTLLECKGDKY
jgi:hypothetical protein